MQERRRAELEAKRQKIAELKARREARGGPSTQRDQAPTPEGSSSGGQLRRADLDDIINQLVGPRSPRSKTPVDSSGPPTPYLAPRNFSPTGRGGRASGPGSDRGTALLGDTFHGPTSGRVSTGSDTGSDIPGQSKETESYPKSDSEAPRERSYVNGSASTTTTPQLPAPVERPQPIPIPSRFPKIEKITYSQAIQTIDFDDGPTGPSEEEIRRQIQAELEEERAQREKELEKENDELAKHIEEQIRELTEEERASILTSPEFFDFVEESSKIIQRALSDAYDYTRDYRIGAEDETTDYEGKRVKLLCAFSDERWTKNRSITSVDWSPKFPELTAASYNKNPAALNDPDGIVAVWNMHLTDRPEFVFHSQSDVLSVTFSPFHPNLIFGGTYSGQILLWDSRSKHLPVLKSPLSAAGHTYPVYAMQMVGTQNAHSLVTSSTDGMVCNWSVDMLAQPQDTLELVHTGHNKTNEVAITCFDFPDNETTSFWVGTEEGNVYQAYFYDRAGAKAGLNQQDIYRGHNGPVTGLHFHPLLGPIDFTDVFLTCSVDWTIKLWKAKTGTKPGSGIMNVAPIYSFEEADDYVYDVKWHPNHPALFGSVDGSGKFALWNLNQDTEVPVVSTPVGTGRAINKLSWDRKDGRRAALGCSDGKLYVYDIGDLGAPRETEWTDFQKTLGGIMSGNAQTLLPGEERPATPTLNGIGRV
ncbi:WD40 repeat-like protein [Clavulina sp. PMI_390]|nr:WD40 repeat-like protein [Clavulina sp. PMI_390]